MKIKRVVYSFVVADLFHYGHLQLLKTAKEAGDYHICGVLSDEAVATYKHRPVANYEERHSVISSICYVDKVLKQARKDPTENLMAIHAEFPEATIVLIHGDDWRDVPGRDYVESIGGELIQPEYYKRLADGRIKDEIVSSKFHDFELFTEHFRVDGISFYQAKLPKRLLSTKANTLKLLHPLLTKSRIEQTFVFREGDYAEDKEVILNRIQDEFFKKIVVRSSAIDEDTEYSSRAGYYDSVLDVEVTDRQNIEKAIEQVLESYSSKEFSNEHNQVLIQEQTENVKLSGVIFTKIPNTGAPYYLINYDDVSGRTDTVTSGVSGQTLIVAHGEIGDCKLGVWQEVLDAVIEIEGLIPDLALDIEFGLDNDGRVVIYQVRPLVIANEDSGQECNQSQANFAQGLKDLKAEYGRLASPGSDDNGVGGAFSDMAFWNPAEIIGDQSNALAYSIYKLLITDESWNKGLVPLGYTELKDKTLMQKFGGKAYIDLRKTFHALLPSTITNDLRRRLVQGSLDRLQEHPELHDKVEFEVLDSSFIFDFDEIKSRYYSYGLDENDYEAFVRELKVITADLFARFEEISNTDMALINALNARREAVFAGLEINSCGAQQLILAGLELLHDCGQEGTPVFARQARIAFIANALLLSMRRKRYISEDGYVQFLQRLETIASEFHKDYQQMRNGQMSRDVFLGRYCHLRPNTYDINSKRYDQSDDLFHIEGVVDGALSQNLEALDDPLSLVSDKDLLDMQLEKAGLDISLERLMVFIKCGLETREKVKFEFTKNISDALELFAAAGARLGLSRKELACLTSQELTKAADINDEKEMSTFLKDCIVKQESNSDIEKKFVLPSVIFSEKDFLVHKQLKSRPNFITEKKVSGSLYHLVSMDIASAGDIEGKIVLIESADPGYDWIFTRNIKGLITKFGGLASHMAIRCSEFGLPAAIGCGDVHFTDLLQATRVELDCKDKKILPYNAEVLN